MADSVNYWKIKNNVINRHNCGYIYSYFGHFPLDEIRNKAKKLYEQYKDKYPNMILIPGIYDRRELNAVRSNALAYIHSHSRCGTPPSLCEAMYHGLPIISFNAEVNHEVTKENAFFFTTPDDLVSVVENTSKEELKAMAERSLALAKAELTWKHIADQYIELFG